MKGERVVQLTIGVVLLMMVWAVFDSLGHVYNIKDQIKERKDIPTLPKKCGVYYNNGTDDWKNCMGVGYA